MKKDLNFIGKKKIFFGISLTIIVIGIICNIIFGATLDIQFKGGTIISYGFVNEVDEETLKDTIQSATPNNTVTFTVTQDIMNNTDDTKAYAVSIQFSGNKNVSPEEQQAITTALTEKFPENKFEYKETTSVEAAMGLKFLLKCLVAVAIASVLMVLYVTIRFTRIGGLSAGVMALVALFHDVAMIYFLYVIFRMPIDTNFIAVVLMILGYSLNDTIVIYDRVREERRLAPEGADIGGIFNHSASVVMPRTIATSVTTLVAIGVVYIVATIFNLSSVQAFALPMMIGIVSGCYSSLCIAGPLWVMWQNHKLKSAKSEIAKKEANKVYPMKWHKFLVYVCLFIVMAANLAAGVYAIITGNIAQAVLYFVMAVFAFIVRSALYEQYKVGYIILYIFMAVNIVPNLIGLFASGDMITSIVYLSVMGVQLIILLLHVVYYQKRKHMFNKI